MLLWWIGSDAPSDISTVSTAVVMVYIRDDEWDRVVCPVDKFDIPENIRTELEVRSVILCWRSVEICFCSMVAVVSVPYSCKKPHMRSAE